MDTMDTTATPDLASYDVILVNTSAGKDSQAMLDLVVRQAEAAGVRDRVRTVHCTFAEEWEGTEELAQAQAEHYGVPYQVVSRPQGGLLDMVLDRNAKRPDAPSWPSNQNRFCTSGLKRDQVAKVLTAIAAEFGRPVRILNCMGIRAAESPARAKREAFSHDKRATNSKRHVDTWFPIFDWTVEKVWATIKASGAPHHKAYDLGMPRLSCVFCVFAPKAALMLAGKHNRAQLDRFVEVERQVGSSFTQSLRIEDVRDALDRGEEPADIRTWEM